MFPTKKSGFPPSLRIVKLKMFPNFLPGLTRNFPIPVWANLYIDTIKKFLNSLKVKILLD